MKTEETYKIAGLKLGWKTIEEFIGGSETKYSGIGKIFDKYKKTLEKVGMKIEIKEISTDSDFYDTLFNVLGAFSVSKKEGGADCYES